MSLPGKSAQRVLSTLLDQPLKTGTEPAPVFLQIAVNYRESTDLKHMLPILFNKRMIQLLLYVRLRFERFSRSCIWRVAQSCARELPPS